MVFLQGHGVSAAYAARIFKQYGKGSLDVVRENPYRLATDIYGIGFKTADVIAGKLGFDKNSPVRDEAGILHVLAELADEGHVFYPYEPLLTECGRLLEVERDVLTDAFARVDAERRIRVEDMGDGDIPTRRPCTSRRSTSARPGSPATCAASGPAPDPWGICRRTRP